MSSVTVYGRHSPDFFFSEAYSVFVCKVHYLLALFLRIAYRGISSSAFVLDTAYHKVCSVDHTAVADLDTVSKTILGFKPIMDTIWQLSSSLSCICR